MFKNSTLTPHMGQYHTSPISSDAEVRYTGYDTVCFCRNNQNLASSKALRAFFSSSFIVSKSLTLAYFIGSF